MKDYIRARINTLFSNDCHDPEGKFCSAGGSQSVYGPRGEISETQKKYEGPSVTIPSRTEWVGTLNSGQKASLRRERLPIVKIGDKYLAPPPATDHAAYRANQIGIGEMLKGDILKKVVETKTGDFHEEQRADKDPRYDYTLADLPVKIGVPVSKNGHVSTIIVTHEGLDKEAKDSIKAIRKQRLTPKEQANRFKQVEQVKRSKALQLMNEWRVDHKLQPVELIWP
jgi:hypothetical protein